MQNRPLRPFEQAAHLHVLDWAHSTARYRFQDAGRVQVKAGAQAVALAAPHASGPLELPALEAALLSELRKLYALGHATVRSELDYQANGAPVTIGLSAAPEPPGLRKASSKKGKAKNCGTCKMFYRGACWGYGNWPVKPAQVCDSYSPERSPKQLAAGDVLKDPGLLRSRARLLAQAVAHAIWQAVQRARLQGITDQQRLRQIGEQAGSAALTNGASSHTGGAINAGRHAAALHGNGNGNGNGKRSGPVVIGARYTSVLDKNTCGPCAAADDDVLRPLSDPALVHPPNPACLGGDRCRCILVYQLSSEGQPVKAAA